ncbi:MULTISPECIES: DUF2971 domain-containing protein [Rhizobium]|uniref:DUF2971 domain-containing protein n=1 Tax=Rhizobium TaxID=379 RepID=UPI0013EF1964|nr:MULTISPECIES: DUF2971 domain-containing protein [Rhizobium]MBY5733413.1 DUF2971 domain-containing protein [Rhizobium leguminosarum]
MIAADLEAPVVKLPQYKNDPAILYHYCSAATFQAIISRNTIRLSALRSSNDSMEGAWYDGKLLEAIRKQAEDIPGWYFEQQAYINRGATVGLCLTEAGDLLSQWRGYADDGRGFCIGFNGPKLMEFCLMGGQAIKVIYNEDDQEDFIRKLVAKQRQRKLTDLILEVTRNFAFSFKHPAFEEEREWRVIQDVAFEHCDYLAKSTHLSAYKDIGIPEDKRQGLIAEVIIGPGNITSVEMVRGFMLRHGFDSSKCEIKRSHSSYRVR